MFSLSRAQKTFPFQTYTRQQPFHTHKHFSNKTIEFDAIGSTIAYRFYRWKGELVNGLYTRHETECWPRAKV